jgi:hypothetical protein
MTRRAATPVRIAKSVAVPAEALAILKTKATITIISNIEYLTTGITPVCPFLFSAPALLDATASREPK